MTLPILICDDSNMARKQCARSLPDGWDVEVNFASNGFEAIEAIKAGKGDVLLLDLNMPEMDGYEVLQTIVKEDLPTMTVVVSGDIQPEAYKRVTSLGALDFIKKPVNKRILTEVLQKFGIIDQAPVLSEPHFGESADQLQAESQQAAEQTDHDSTKSLAIDEQESPVEQTTQAPQDNNSAAFAPALDLEQASAKSKSSFNMSNELRDCLQEIANVSMGQAGDLLARLINSFVVLPIPNVNFIELNELHMALKSVERGEMTSGICQGFIGGGISGEALLILNDSSFQEVAELVNYKGEITELVELELLMDLANVVIGACLKGISEQLDVRFSQGQPVVLGRHCDIAELINKDEKGWQRTLTIEISYGIEGRAINCDLLLLFTEDSTQLLHNKLSYLLD